MSSVLKFGSVSHQLKLTDWPLTRDLTDVFDGAMITLAIYTMNFFHPGRLLNHLGVGKPRGQRAVDVETPPHEDSEGTVIGTPRNGGGSLDMKEVQPKPV